LIKLSTRRTRVLKKAFMLGAIAVGCASLVGSSAAEPAKPAQTITATAASLPQFTTLVSLLKQARLASALGSKGPYTVFAPTNAAFARLPRTTLDAVKSEPALLRKALLYHVVKGDIRAAQVLKLDGKTARTLAGKRVTIDVRGGTVFLNDTVRVTKTGVLATNGVIHVINKVLVPQT
jgi:uncharacterized surface protein with fasciclin (FAS1) repeats